MTGVHLTDQRSARPRASGGMARVRRVRGARARQAHGLGQQDRTGGRLVARAIRRVRVGRRVRDGGRVGFGASVGAVPERQEAGARAVRRRPPAVLCAHVRAPGVRGGEAQDQAGGDRGVEREGAVVR